MGVGVGKIIQVMEWWAYVKMLLMFETDNARCLMYGRGYIYPTAVEYHLRHLRIAQELFDKV